MHDIKYIHTESFNEEYNCTIHHMIIQCRGCSHTSFRYVFEDIESAYPTSNNDWVVPKIIEIYPKFLEGHRQLDGMIYVPDIVREIYQESLTATQEGAGVLAGLGLRGTIEAICNDRGITGRTLDSRISKLAAQGFISQKDAERLHAIRFLGNDAAHEIKKPTDNQIEIALKIIEYLITTVYILDKEAKGKLDTVVVDLSEFKKLLEANLKNYAPGDEYPLAKFLGKDVRRMQGALSRLEAELIDDITAGNYSKLAIGKIDGFGTPPIQRQYFKIT